MVLWFFSTVVSLFPFSALDFLCSFVVLQFYSCKELTEHYSSVVLQYCGLVFVCAFSFCVCVCVCVCVFILW